MQNEFLKNRMTFRRSMYAELYKYAHVRKKLSLLQLSEVFVAKTYIIVHGNDKVCFLFWHDFQVPRKEKSIK